MHRFLLILPLLVIPFCAVEPVCAENLTTYAGEMKSDGAMPPCARCNRPYLDHVQTADGQLMCPGAWFGRRQPNQPILPRQNPILPRPFQPEQPNVPEDANPYDSDPLPPIPGLVPSSPAPGIEPSEPDEPDVQPAPVTPAPGKVEKAEEKSNVGFFGRVVQNIKDRTNNFTGGIFTVVGLGVAALVIKRLWHNVVRKKVVKYVDRGQDLIELWVEKQRGPEYADAVRDVMEDLESGILAYVDQYVNGINTTKTVAGQMEKEKLRASLNVKGKQPTIEEVVAAVRQASKELGDESVTTSVPKRVEEILAGKVKVAVQEVKKETT